MKEHKEPRAEGPGPGDLCAGPARVLKSLLKKPGQPRSRGPRNRVVINEKMNEFFAADYIILIKEECCADYEEECDCCCQEHEMIRLGNCKECRAELNLRFEEPGPTGHGPGNSILDLCDRGPDDECEDDEDEDDECDEEDEDLEDRDEDEEPELLRPEPPAQPRRPPPRRHPDLSHEESVAATPPPPAASHQSGPKDKVASSRRHQQRETLSPPEGYKDLCVAAQAQQELDDSLLLLEEEGRAVCAECDYYQRQAAEAAGANGAEGPAGRSDETRHGAGHLQESWRSASQDSEEAAVAGATQSSIDQAQQTTPDVQQRYLVETITMTTVTERRIVREISEEESRPALDDADSTMERQSSIDYKSPNSVDNSNRNGPPSDENSLVKMDDLADKEKPSELSLAFKLGSVSSLVSNSLKPNSAVRQLFPDPRFISPPPAPVKSVSQDLEDGALDEVGDNQFLITTESLRLFDAVKRTKIGTGNRSDSSESDSSIKRTIERNALRRSLICKYETGGTLKKKNLRSKDLTLEERIRQLTCVDEDEDTADSSASENNNTGRINVQNHNNNNNNRLNGLDRTISETNCDEHGLMIPAHQLPARTSPSGEERPKGHVVQSHGGHHHHHQHHTNSAYRKITDLFVQKKNSSANQGSDLNLPDIGLGTKHNLGSKANASGAKMNTEARKQFLSSLAPLSCVASSGVDGREDYYRMPTKMNPGERNSICYNSESSYSLEDIEDALKEGIPAPPDVTRGTPTSAGPSVDAFNTDPSDELMAFVEQDKGRTERIKRRYNDAEEQQRASIDTSAIEIPKNVTNLSNNTDAEDEDDELNDYGFNRRPSVRGIKAQFETTNEIVRQLRSRSAAANSLPEACRLGFSGTGVPGPPGHEDDAAGSSASSDVYRVTYTNEIHGDHNTINRINNMQKQINDIYQSIAESSVASALLDQRPGSYLESTLTRGLQGPEVTHRFAGDPKNGLHAGTLLNPARMLRMAGGADAPSSVTPAGVYSTLPRNHRHPQVSATYSAGYSVLPAAAAAANPAAAKCYRTMYFVPYNGLSDPTYQNLQRILPPHSSPTNYAEHVERYPYPRNGRIDPQQPQPQPRYYVRPASIPAASSALHLHLHQTEEFQVSAQTTAARSQTLPHGSAIHPMHAQLQQVHLHQQQQQQQQQQLASTQNYVQTISGVTYSICPPPPPSQATATYTYQMQIQGRLASSDVQTQTNCAPTTQLTSSLLSGGLLSQGALPSAGMTSGTASLMSSPTKSVGHPQFQRSASCSVAERGVPEGAASAPSHDYVGGGGGGQASSAGLLASTTQSAASIAASFVAADAQPGPIVDGQNPVYYAMNV